MQPRRLKTHKRNWEDLADVDPLWAILTHSDRRHGGWNLDEFFLSGEREIATVMAAAERLEAPARRERALDFGCGVGRLTRALASRFTSCDGVDISEHMIEQARELNRAYPKCHFTVNTAGDLKLFPDDAFDLIYSNLVLQHIPNRGAIEAYIVEFVRVLRPDGLLAFQLPSHIPLRRRARPRSRLYAALRAIGVSHAVLYNSLGLHPITMNAIPIQGVENILARAGARAAHIETEQTPHYQSSTYYVVRQPSAR